MIIKEKIAVFFVESTHLLRFMWFSIPWDKNHGHNSANKSDPNVCYSTPPYCVAAHRKIWWQMPADRIFILPINVDIYLCKFFHRHLLNSYYIPNRDAACNPNSENTKTDVMLLTRVMVLDLVMLVIRVMP